MGLDLALLGLLALAAAAGAWAGALRQAVSLGAAVLGWLAARHLGGAVAAGLERWIPAFAARAAAGALLFFGVMALASIAGGILLRGTGLAAVVRGPVDRGLGGLVGGAKAALVGWVLLSVAALGARALPDRAERTLARSELFGLAREQNLLVRLDAGTARSLERLVQRARALRGGGPDDPDARRLLEHPGLRGLADGEGALDAAEAERALEDPAVRALVERIRAGAAARDRAAGAR